MHLSYTLADRGVVSTQAPPWRNERPYRDIQNHDLRDLRQGARDCGHELCSR